MVRTVQSRSGLHFVALCSRVQSVADGLTEALDSSCSPGLTAELSGCDRKRFSSAALNKKEEDPIIRAGGRGVHCRYCGGEQSAAV